MSDADRWDQQNAAKARSRQLERLLTKKGAVQKRQAPPGFQPVTPNAAKNLRYLLNHRRGRL
ncbi:MAG TPA: hypothetical protein VGC99_14425 [Candidatus Tectomicrobia bacterium]